MIDALPGPPRAIVVDASVAVEMLEGNPTWLDRWTSWVDGGAILLTAQNFTIEVANALLRSRRIPAADATVRMTRLWDSGIAQSNRGLPELLESIELADRHQLTVYDAAYLQIALAVEADVATTDHDLATAARREGLAVV